MDIVTKRGDTWPGMILEILANESPLDLTGASFKMQIKTFAANDEIALDLSETIVSENPTTGVLTVPPVKIDLPARSYVFDLEISLPEKTITPISGTLTVTQDVSR